MGAAFAIRGRERSGFSLMEALVTLTIGSLLLSVLFGLTSQFVDQGFRLGNRALAQAERFPGRESLEMVLDSLILPGGGFGIDGEETSFHGRSDEISAMSLAARSTRCGPAGYRRVRLRLEADENSWTLTCSLQDREAVELASGPGPAPRFEYEGDDEQWVTSADRFSPYDASARSAVAPIATDELLPPLLRLRLVAPDGQTVVAAIAERPRVVARPFSPAADE